MGWGATSYGGPSSEKLLKGSLNIVDNAECNKSFTDEDQMPKGIVPMQICAADPSRQRDTW
jgi:hypothetical protein